MYTNFNLGTVNSLGSVVITGRFQAIILIIFAKYFFNCLVKCFNICICIYTCICGRQALQAASCAGSRVLRNASSAPGNSRISATSCSKHANTQIHKYKYTNIQIHKYQYTNNPNNLATAGFQQQAAPSTILNTNT